MNFSQLVRQYERLVYTICYQFTKTTSWPRILPRETFLSAYTHRDDCPPGSYKPRLARIATNKAKDYLKSAYHRRVSAAEDGEMPAVADVLNAMPPPEDITIAKDEAARIRDTILALKEPFTTRSPYCSSRRKKKRGRDRLGAAAAAQKQYIRRSTAPSNCCRTP